jgi:hypothetical protein
LGDVKVIKNPECTGWWWEEFAIWSLRSSWIVRRERGIAMF